VDIYLFTQKSIALMYFIDTLLSSVHTWVSKITETCWNCYIWT